MKIKYSGLIKFLILFTVLQTVMSGCGTTQYEALRKKLIREKKKVEKPTRFLTEPVKRPADDLYREHFLYFKTWNETLARNLGGNRKRELEALRETRRHLISLPKYLEDEYANGLLARVTAFEKMTADLEKKTLTTTQNSILARHLNGLAVQIENKYAFNDMKDHMKRDTSRIDLSDYPDEDLKDVLLYKAHETNGSDSQTTGEISNDQTQSAAVQPAK